MKLLKVLLLLLLPLAANAQKKDTIYFDAAWKETDKSTAEYYRVLSKTEDKGWKAEDHFLKNDTLQMSGYYKTKACKIRQGNFTYYNIKGYKTSECTYINDKREGHYISYNTGFKDEEGDYREGLKIGTWTGYRDSSAEVWYKEKFADGKDLELRSFYPGGKLKRIETPAEDGSKTSTTGKCYDMNGKEIPYTPFMIFAKPSYSVSDFLAQNMRYPDYAKRHNIEGRVIVLFVVDEDGNISHVEAVQKIGAGCDEEAIRVVGTMPRWEPGIRDDKAIKVYFHQPISFKLK